MIKIEKYSLGELQANCYFVIEGNDCVIIDPADEAGFILEKLARENLELVGMIATHGHFDHIMAAGEIQLSLDVPFCIHEKDLFLVKRLNETAKHFLNYDPVALPPKRIDFLPDGDFQISNFKFQIIPTPGHTPGSVCLLFSDGNPPGFKSDLTPGVEEEQLESYLFSGDTLFKSAIGRYDFSYSDKKLLDESLEKLFKLPKETIVYPGHGEETTIGEEKINKIIYQLP